MKNLSTPIAQANSCLPLRREVACVARRRERKAVARLFNNVDEQCSPLQSPLASPVQGEVASHQRCRRGCQKIKKFKHQSHHARLRAFYSFLLVISFFIYIFIYYMHICSGGVLTFFALPSRTFIHHHVTFAVGYLQFLSPYVTFLSGSTCRLLQIGFYHQVFKFSLIRSV